MLRRGLNPGGPGFFRNLADSLAQALAADSTFMDRLPGDLRSAENLAVHSGGQFKGNTLSSLNAPPR